MPKLIRWALRAATVALVVGNAWWAWGDRTTPGMKAIDASIARGPLDEAERSLRRRVAWSRSDGEARMKLARLLVKRGDPLGGLGQLHEVPAWWPTKAEALFLEGQTAKLANHARAAEAAWKACLADDPLHPVPSALFHGAGKELVTHYVLETRLDEVRQVLWRVYADSSPEDRPGVLATRMRLELERIDHEEAADRLRKYLGADPDDFEARRALAIEEHAIGDEAGADRDLEICLKTHPDDPMTWRTRLAILDDRGDVEASREAIARVPSTVSDDARIEMYRAIDRQRRGDQSGALDAFRRSATLAPDDAEVFYKLGRAEIAAGLAAEGRQHVARSLQLRRDFETLRGGHQVFLDQARRTPRDLAGYRSSIQQLATACRALGWVREADAWLSQLPPG